MSSQKSSTVPAEALAPKRARGRLRVTAILDAAAAVFAERGFEAATMSEIAARSSTAIGSLYRFFPTKETLADALLQRYVGDIGLALDAIEAQAASLAPEAIADALFDLMRDARQDRTAVAALLDVRADADDRRSALRERLRRSIAAILRAVEPDLDATHAAIVASVLLQLLKCISALAAEPEPKAARLAELRIAIRLYVAHCVASPAVSPAP